MLLVLYVIGLALVLAGISGQANWRWGALGVGLLLGIGIFDYAQRWPYL